MPWRIVLMNKPLVDYMRVIANTLQQRHQFGRRFDLLLSIIMLAMGNAIRSWPDIGTKIFSKRFYFNFILIVFFIILAVLFQQSSKFGRILKLITHRNQFKIEAEQGYGAVAFDPSVLHPMKYPLSGIAVEALFPFLDRVRVYNQALHHLRMVHLRKRGSGKWRNISSVDEIQVIGGADDDFLYQLANFTQMETLFLPWIHDKAEKWTSFKDTSNILINEYFEWTADEEICQWIETPGKTTAVYDVMFNRTCTRDIEKTVKPQSLRLLTLNSKPLNKEIYWPNDGKAYPLYFYSDPPPFAFYLHIIHDGIVSSYSEAWSGNMQLVHFGCSYRKAVKPPSNIDAIPLYDEVIALSQYWGEGTFHRMIEVIPRLSLYVEFLKRNPEIRILATHTGGQTAELLAILGISKNRIISGFCRAKLLYLPRSTMCGWANVQEIQVVSMLFRKYVTENFPPEPRNKVVLIQRSGKRRFSENKAIEAMVRQTAAAHNLSFSLFIDNPVPSLNETMKMFHSAVLIVAPHGAGLSNAIFSQPGTFVVEVVCGPPFINLCYQRLSEVIGHHWRGIHPQGGCYEEIKVSINSLQADIVKTIALLK